MSAADAWALVVELANGPPTHDARGPLVCGFCDETMARDRDSRDVDQHYSGCLYRRAALLVAMRAQRDAVDRDLAEHGVDYFMSDTNRPEDES